MKGSGKRLLSLDALRGFDMFFITGGAMAISGLCAALGRGDSWLAAQMQHVDWTGLAHHDTIFPLFLFLAGVSWPFSLGSQLAHGRSVWRIQAKILLRTAVLFLIGLSFGGILQFKPDFRLMGVLQFIGLSWGLAATLWLHVRRERILAVIAAVLLVWHYALLHFGIAPGAPADAWSYSPEWNIVFWLDKAFYPSHVVMAWGCEPESLFAVPSGVALALFGMLAGAYLKRGEEARDWRRSAVLAAFAAAGCLLTCVSVRILGVPIIKKLWTASFILAAASYSLFLLALFHFIVDVLGWRRWTIVFDAVGKNSILAYMMTMTGVAGSFHHYLFGGLCEWAGAWRLAVTGLTSYLMFWAVLAFLKRKGVFLKA